MASEESEREKADKAAIPRRVLVTGASGPKGTLVVRGLLEQLERLQEAEPPDPGGGPPPLVRALVRGEAGKEKLLSSIGPRKGLEVVFGDVTDRGTLAAAFESMDAAVVCTSAAPRLSMLSLARVVATKLLTFSYVSSTPHFWFDEGQSPEQVDWLGQQAQFDAAEAAGLKHVVLVSSLGGSRPGHVLNASMQNIALWKRKAECALVSSGLPYTIIHQGDLLPHPRNATVASAPGGQRQLVVGLNDAMVDDASQSQVPFEDLAAVCVRCVFDAAISVGRSFDLGSGPEGEGQPFKGNLKDLLAPLQGANTTYSQADAAFCALETKNQRGCNCF